MKTIEVAAAIIRRGERIFATQRGNGRWKDWWEFPGGKMESGETPSQALEREIREELDADVRVYKELCTVEWDYPEFHLKMHCFMCLFLSESLHLLEHEAARWLSADELGSVRWLPPDEQILPQIVRELETDTLERYIEEVIIPKYAAFDKAHREDHVRAVIDRALQMGERFDLDRDILLAAAACHDMGLGVDRSIHHLESGRIIRSDESLGKWFSREQIETIAQAAEDHRASSSAPPRSLYGAIVAEADRMIEPRTIIRRTVQYGLSHYPELDREGHWERTLSHLREKYAEGGYLHLLIEGSPNEEPLRQLRAIIRDIAALRSVFDEIFDEESPA